MREADKKRTVKNISARRIIDTQPCLNDLPYSLFLSTFGFLLMSSDHSE